MLLGGAAPEARVDLTVTGLRSTHGTLLVCLTMSPAHFPDCVGDPAARHFSAPANQPLIRFADLPSGEYAIALIHDENDDGKLDTRWGIPREGLGFSRNPRLIFGPPSFAAARFAVAGKAVAETIHVKYFL